MLSKISTLSSSFLVYYELPHSDCSFCAVLPFLLFFCNGYIARNIQHLQEKKVLEPRRNIGDCSKRMERV